MPRRSLALVLSSALVLPAAVQAQPVDVTAGKGSATGLAAIGLRGAVAAGDRIVIGHGNAAPVMRPAFESVTPRSGFVQVSGTFSGVVGANALTLDPWRGSRGQMEGGAIASGGTFRGGSYMSVGAALAALSSRSREATVGLDRVYTLPVAAASPRPARPRLGGSTAIGKMEWMTGLAMARRLDVAIPAALPVGAGLARRQFGSVHERTSRTF